MLFHRLLVNVHCSICKLILQQSPDSVTNSVLSYLHHITANMLWAEPCSSLQALRQSAQEATERSQKLEKDLADQKAAVEEQKAQVAEGETERKRLEAMVAEANDHQEEFDRLRQGADSRAAELAAIQVQACLTSDTLVVKALLCASYLLLYTCICCCTHGLYNFAAEQASCMAMLS